MNPREALRNLDPKHLAGVAAGAAAIVLTQTLYAAPAAERAAEAEARLSQADATYQQAQQTVAEAGEQGVTDLDALLASIRRLEAIVPPDVDDTDMFLAAGAASARTGVELGALERQDRVTTGGTLDRIPYTIGITGSDAAVFAFLEDLSSSAPAVMTVRGMELALSGAGIVGDLQVTTTVDLWVLAIEPVRAIDETPPGGDGPPGVPDPFGPPPGDGELPPAPGPEEEGAGPAPQPEDGGTIPDPFEDGGTIPDPFEGEGAPDPGGNEPPPAG